MSGNYEYLDYTGKPSDKNMISVVVLEVTSYGMEGGGKEENGIEGGQVVYQNEIGESAGSFMIDVGGGVRARREGAISYVLCVGNGMRKPRGRWPNEFGERPARKDGKTRKFGINMRGLEKGAKKDNGEAGSLKETKMNVMALLDVLKSIQDHQTYMRKNEKDHRDVTELTNERVYKWTIAEILIVVVVGVVQVRYLGNFMQKSKTM